IDAGRIGRFRRRSARKKRFGKADRRVRHADRPSLPLRPPRSPHKPLRLALDQASRKFVHDPRGSRPARAAAPSSQSGLEMFSSHSSVVLDSILNVLSTVTGCSMFFHISSIYPPDYRRPIIAGRLSLADYRGPIIAGRLSPADYRRPIIASRLSPADYRQPAINVAVED